MARFDVYPQPDPGANRSKPCLLEVQNEFIAYIGTRVLVPLLRATLFKPRLRDIPRSSTWGAQPW